MKISTLERKGWTRVTFRWFYFEAYYTKEQTQRIFAAWEVSEPLPPKGKAVYVNLVSPSRLATVTRSTKRSTTGKVLYHVTIGQR